jgi:hypothetical protein
MKIDKKSLAVNLILAAALGLMFAALPAHAQDETEVEPAEPVIEEPVIVDPVSTEQPVIIADPVAEEAGDACYITSNVTDNLIADDGSESGFSEEGTGSSEETAAAAYDVGGEAATAAFLTPLDYIWDECLRNYNGSRMVSELAYALCVLSYPGDPDGTCAGEHNDRMADAEAAGRECYAKQPCKK